MLVCTAGCFEATAVGVYDSKTSLQQNVYSGAIYINKTNGNWTASEKHRHKTHLMIHPAPGAHYNRWTRNAPLSWQRASVGLPRARRVRDDKGCALNVSSAHVYERSSMADRLCKLAWNRNEINRNLKEVHLSRESRVMIEPTRRLFSEDVISLGDSLPSERSKLMRYLNDLLSTC